MVEGNRKVRDEPWGSQGKKYLSGGEDSEERTWGGLREFLWTRIFRNDPIQGRRKSQVTKRKGSLEETCRKGAHHHLAVKERGTSKSYVATLKLRRELYIYRVT